MHVCLFACLLLHLGSPEPAFPSCAKRMGRRRGAGVQTHHNDNVHRSLEKGGKSELHQSQKKKRRKKSMRSIKDRTYVHRTQIQGKKRGGKCVQKQGLICGFPVAPSNVLLLNRLSRQLFHHLVSSFCLSVYLSNDTAVSPFVGAPQRQKFLLHFVSFCFVGSKRKPDL